MQDYAQVLLNVQVSVLLHILHFGYDTPHFADDLMLVP